MRQLEVIIPTYHSKEMTSYLIESCEKFKPLDMDLIYHVIENSSDISYRDDILALSNKVRWYNNPDADTNKDASNNKPSWANCSAVDFVREQVKTEFVLLCHNDCVVTSSSFFEELRIKIKEGYKMIGTSVFPTEPAPLHIAGLLVETDLLNRVGVTPDFSRNLDVGDILTIYCRDNGIPFFVFDNTINNSALVDKCNEPWKSLGPDCGIDRALNSTHTEVIYAHLGRGSQKNFNFYSKSGKILLAGWKHLCTKFVIGADSND